MSKYFVLIFIFHPLFCNKCTTQISTIVQPIDRMAEESVKNLCELINGKKVKNKKSILIPEFRKGGTTV